MRVHIEIFHIWRSKSWQRLQVSETLFGQFLQQDQITMQKILNCFFSKGQKASL